MTTEHSSKAMIADKDILTTKFEVHSLKYLLFKITLDSYVSLQPRLCRGKEMSLSSDLGLYYKWPKSDPNAVFELPMRPKCSF